MVRDEDLPTIKENFGRVVYVDLASHGPAGDKWNVLVLEDSHIQPKAAWIKFPPLMDSKTTLAESAIPHEALADLGLTGEETAIQAAVMFGAINPQMDI